MNIKIGAKIKELRKARNISQEVLAQYLNVSFQAVSKWEQELTMPDIELIPAIAAFFDVSTDELFDYNRLEKEAKIEKICDEAYTFRKSDPGKSEKILRMGLKQFPGNEILLNNLLYVINTPERYKEVISLCTALSQSAKLDDVRFDAVRILAETYHVMGRQELVKPTLDKLPEIYFTKLELAARLLEGQPSLDAAESQLIVSLEHLLSMLLKAENYLRSDNPPKSRAYHETAVDVARTFKNHKPEIFESPFFSDEVRRFLNKSL